LDNSEGIKPESINTRFAASPPPPPNSDAPDSVDSEENFFSPGNLVMIGMLLALLAFLFYKFNLQEMWWIVKAGLGLSFVIFIHELGHFLAAKWCNVNVTTFSIGFGPPIPGCHFTWGETTYKLAILPLGGYVQMVGQVDGDEASDGSEDDPRSYRRKTVGQRMLIISAGVIMNAILAVACFIYVYQVPGRNYPSAVVNYVDSGRPVAVEGLRTGAVIKKIGDVEKPHFDDLKREVIFSTANEPIELVFQVPGGNLQSVYIESKKDKHEKMRAIGIANPYKLQLASTRNAKEGPFYAGTPAHDANFEHDDLILATTDPDQEPAKYDAAKLKDLPDDPRYPEHGQRDYFEFARRMQLLADKDVVIKVRRGKDNDVKELDLLVKPMVRLQSGVVMQMGQIMTVRKKSSADTEGVRGPTAAGEQKFDGDLILAVTVKEADGKEKVFKDNTLDPERLPFELRQWSERLDRAGFKGERTVTLKLRRHDTQPGKQFVEIEKSLAWNNDWQFDKVAPLSANSPMPIPELGLAYQIRSVVIQVTDKSSPLNVGDVVKNIRIDMAGFKEDASIDWSKNEIEEGQWAYVSNLLFHQMPRKITKIVYKVERSIVGEDKKTEKKILEVELPIKPDPTWPLPERGWILSPDTRHIIAPNPVEAVKLGFIDTNKRMMEVFLTIRGIARGDIDPSVIGGPFTIAAGAYHFASMDFGDLVFFLGLISINLAVVNFLPIPILDGGHMVFLIYEKLRGKPASEGVRVWATYAGLAMIGCLMIFVLYQDVMRFVF
jgi:regulator of sigma E protease